MVEKESLDGWTRRVVVYGGVESSATAMSAEKDGSFDKKESNSEKFEKRKRLIWREREMN